MMEDMPKLYEGRIDYLTPSFQALIKAQVSLTRYFCRKGLKLTKDASVNLVSGLGFRKGSGARHRLGSDPPLMGIENVALEHRDCSLKLRFYLVRVAIYIGQHF